MLNSIEIGGRIRKKREEMGYTREQLADIIDKSARTIYEIEDGNVGMSTTTLSDLALALELSADYILFGTLTDNYYSSILQLLNRCPKEKLPALEKLIKYAMQFEGSMKK